LDTTVDGRKLLTGTMPEWRLSDDVTVGAKDLTVTGLPALVGTLEQLVDGLESDENDIEEAMAD